MHTCLDLLETDILTVRCKYEVARLETGLGDDTLLSIHQNFNLASFQRFFLPSSMHLGQA